ncbi:hypothetical protein BAUCODRAFT_31579, partial [Baudoinia panamericana UAMH 10762]
MVQAAVWEQSSKEHLSLTMMIRFPYRRPMSNKINWWIAASKWCFKPLQGP